jgi:predicted AlkP superfamily pyrophosphatase or phosphodiesterase
VDRVFPMAWNAALPTLMLVGGLLTAQPIPGDVPVPQRAAGTTTKVLVVTVDSLSPRAIRLLGPERAPTLHRLIEEGASTLNARTVREQTRTLPNHTSIVTGRRVRASQGGHGVDWNDERRRPATVQRAAGHRVRSVFTVVDSPGRHPGLFVSKRKLALFKRSWRRGVDRFVVRENNRRLVRLTRADLARHRRAFTFLHLSRPDVVGHDKGFLSRAYLDAVAHTDRRLGTLLRTIEARPRLRDHLTLILTADHGGKGAGHNNPRRLVDYRVPFLVWGANVTPGTDLYELNPDYRDPGKRRTRYGAKRPPIRNADAANLALDLLGLGPIPHSEFDVRQRLDVARR